MSAVSINAFCWSFSACVRSFLRSIDAFACVNILLMLSSNNSFSSFSFSKSAFCLSCNVAESLEMIFSFDATLFSVNSSKISSSCSKASRAVFLFFSSWSLANASDSTCLFTLSMKAAEKASSFASETFLAFASSSSIFLSCSPVLIA